jgi:hypothetical protein
MPYNQLLLGESYKASRLDYCSYYNVEENYSHLDLPSSPFNTSWAHLELGAGNYGLEGHTKVSQRMTVLAGLSYVSSKPNYVDNLQERDQVEYNPQAQYFVLFRTLDKLVKLHGPRGIFHVNDLFPQYADYAATRLAEYAQSKGYKHITIEPVSGDYTQLSPRLTLAKYGKLLYDSVHLKNPEVHFYNYGLDGDEFLSNPDKRRGARETLQQLADLSYTGLYFFPVNPRYSFIPKIEYEEFISRGKFYQMTDVWPRMPYVFPENKVFNMRYSSVYFIPHNYTCSD